MTDQEALPGFADGKEPHALRTIGEVTKALNIRQHVLRYWEEQFPMLRPIKRNGGRRYYRPEDVRLLMTIERLVYREGYTLRGARLAIESGEAGVSRQPPQPSPRLSELPPMSTSPSPDNELEITSELQRIRQLLAEALAAS